MNRLLRDELVQLSIDLIGCASTADRPDQLTAVIDYVEHYLKPIPNLYIHRSEVEGKPAIVATLRETHAPKLMLNAHLDVVPARQEQFKVEIRDNRIYGRGAQDMKGSAAVLLRLIKDLAALDSRPDVGFQFVSDEEIGGEHGTERLLDEGWLCDFFIALEPTDMRICYEQKGPMWLDLHIPGNPAHGSRPWEGHNPIGDLHYGLEKLQQQSPAPQQGIWRTTITPTVIQSNSTARNQVSPGILLSFDIRYTSDDTAEGIQALIQECFPTAEIHVMQSSFPLQTDPDTQVVRRLADTNARIRKQPTEFYREHFASDARFYSKVGIPAVCFGPIGAGLHSNEEWVAIDGLVELYRVMMAYIQE